MRKHIYRLSLLPALIRKIKPNYKSQGHCNTTSVIMINQLMTDQFNPIRHGLVLLWSSGYKLQGYMHYFSNGFLLLLYQLHTRIGSRHKWKSNSTEIQFMAKQTPETLFYSLCLNVTHCLEESHVQIWTCCTAVFFFSLSFMELQGETEISR